MIIDLEYVTKVLTRYSICDAVNRYAGRGTNNENIERNYCSISYYE